ncbi:DNA-binding protein [Gautieria morchelliformis]|nr:DNA-binding protein [Gautieria morchelliformis]
MHTERRIKNLCNATETARAIVDFLEVAIHNILYVRQIYPVDLFSRRKKYDTPVWRSRHPELNEYISGAVKAVGEELILGNVDKVVVVIKDHNEVALERFIFSIKHMIQPESYDRDERIVGAISGNALTQYFRSFLVKLSMVESQLGPLIHNDNASFAIVLELQPGKAPLASQGKGDLPPWNPAPRQHTTEGASENAELHLVRAVETGVINIALGVQESEEKLDRLEDWLGANVKGKRKAL